MCIILYIVSIGRVVMSLFGVSQAPEIYTAAIGIYTLWLVIRFGSTIANYIMQGTEILLEQMKLWSLQGVKCAIAGFLLFVVIPLLLGHLVDLLLISPLRVPHDRTPVFYPSTVSPDILYDIPYPLKTHKCNTYYSVSPTHR